MTEWTTDKGYELGGLPVWFHPLRFDRYLQMRREFPSYMRKRIKDEEKAAGRDVSKARIDGLLDDARRDDEKARRRSEAPSLGHLSIIRDHHLKNGGTVYDMSKIGPYLEATWADGVTLDHAGLGSSAVYVHFGETLEYDKDNPASLIEGVYITHVDSPEHGWMMTFVTNYPTWSEAEGHGLSVLERHFAQFVAFIIPDGFDIASGGYSKLQLVGDRNLASTASLWHLGRLAANALLYFNRSRTDVQASMTTYNAAISGTRKANIFEVGFDEVKLNVDWNAARLRPGRWRVADAGDNTRPMTVEWIAPQLVGPTAPHDGVEKGGVVLEFKRRVRVKNDE